MATCFGGVRVVTILSPKTSHRSAQAMARGIPTATRGFVLKAASVFPEAKSTAVVVPPQSGQGSDKVNWSGQTVNRWFVFWLTQ